MLHSDVGPGGLALFRIVVFGLWALSIVHSPSLVLAADAPRELFDPPGVLGLLPGAFWDALFEPVRLRILEVGLLVLFVAAAVGARPWWLIGPLAFAGALMLDGLHKGFGGFVNHAQMALVYSALFLAIAPAAVRRWPATKDDAEQGHGAGLYRFPLIATAVVFAAAYSLIGLYRVFEGGWTIFAGDALATYMGLRTFEVAVTGFDWSLLLIGSPLLLWGAKAGFLVTTVFEILSPLCLAHDGFRRAWLVVMVGFHLTTLVTMNIFFWENLVLLAVVFTRLPSQLPS